MPALPRGGSPYKALPLRQNFHVRPSAVTRAAARNVTRDGNPPPSLQNRQLRVSSTEGVERLSAHESLDRMKLIELVSLL